MNTVFENQRKRLTLWTNYVVWKNVLLLSTYRCKNVEKVDRLFLAALEKNAMRTKKGMKFYHSFDKCDDDDPAAAAQVFIFFLFHDLE